MNDKTMDQHHTMNDDVNETNDLAVALKPDLIPAVQPKHEMQAVPTITPAQARVEAVAALLHKAYEKAGAAPITLEEAKALTAPFGDEDFYRGAGGKDDLIYIQHASLRGRLNSVLGPGQWALVVRDKWAEDYRTARGTSATRVYCEAVLIIRGAYAGEAIGDMSYFKNNESSNYGDAYEGAKSGALRRAVKELGIGLQAWDKAWCEGWKNRHARGTRPIPAEPEHVHEAPPAPAAPKSEPTAKAPEAPKPATQRTKDRFLELLKPIWDTAKEYYVKTGRILSTEDVSDLPLDYVPRTKEELEAIMHCIRLFADGASVEEAAEPTPSGTELSGYVKWLDEKTTKTGKPKYSILIAKSNEKGVKSDDDRFVASFSSTDFETAKKFKHQFVSCKVTENEYGLNLVEHSMILADVPTP